MAQQSWFQSFLPQDGFNDNWTPYRNYLTVGFRPGQALQSRELLEMQTIIMHQISTTNRTMFKHGQPRIDLEEDSLTEAAKSPVTTTGNNNYIIKFKLNAQFFANFSLAANVANDPNGFWITIPPRPANTANSYEQDISSLVSGQSEPFYIGFEVAKEQLLSGGVTDYGCGDVLNDPHASEYQLQDPATGYGNSGAIGADRLRYRVINQDDKPFDVVCTSPQNTVNYLTISTTKREQGSYFVPIIYRNNGSNYWAFDQSTPIPTG